MVQVPLAKPSIMLGVNQTFMMALGIVVIAAFVGADGLGQSVLDGLQRADVGTALNGGIAIVVMAIVLDRVTTAWSVRSRTRRRPFALGGRVVARGGGRSSRRSWSRSSRSVVGREVLRQQEFPERFETSTRRGCRRTSVVEWSQANLQDARPTR